MITPSPHVSMQATLRLVLLYPLKHTHVVPLGILFMLGSHEVQFEDDVEQVLQGAVQFIEILHRKVVLSYAYPDLQGHFKFC